MGGGNPSRLRAQLSGEGVRDPVNKELKAGSLVDLATPWGNQPGDPQPFRSVVSLSQANAHESSQLAEGQFWAYCELKEYADVVGA